MLKKIFFNISVIAIVIIVLDFTIGYTLRYFYFKETSGLNYRTTYSMDSTKAEVLIFGSSRANHDYVPEIFEDSLKQTFYNTGRDGNGIFYQQALVKTILKRYTPKIMVFEYAGTFAKGCEEYEQMASLLPYYRTHPEIRKIIELRSPYEKIKMLSGIYPFNSQLLTIAVGNLEMNKKREIDNKGYIALNKEWQYELDSVADKKYTQIDSNKIRAFRETITDPKNAGAQVFVVFSPVFQKYSRNDDLVLCEKLCAAENIPFFDFSKDSSFLANRAWFQDVLHLNHKGATEFSKLLVSKINQYRSR